MNNRRAAKAIAAMESDMRRDQMGERAKQEAEIQDQLQQRIKDIDKLKITEQEAEDLRVKAREAANAKMLKLQEQFRLQDMELAASGAQATFDLLKGLTKMSEKDTEASAKKAFNRNKAISIAETNA